MVPTVVRVHFLNLKSLVCILISMGFIWDIGTKIWYVFSQGFESQMCALTIPTICTIDTMMKVVRRIKQRHDFLANNSGCRYSPRPHKTPSSLFHCLPSTPPLSAINLAIIVTHVIAHIITHVISHHQLPPLSPRLLPTATATAVRRHPPA